ncbi:Gypsy retrotransposon integrase-like protein 1 [Sesbania bispinosa]|nr:Gypsy retrotransposon integrase-like protein 1 [Sesbania bispinosa]
MYPHHQAHAPQGVQWPLYGLPPGYTPPVLTNPPDNHTPTTNPDPQSQMPQGVQWPTYGLPPGYTPPQLTNPQDNNTTAANTDPQNQAQQLDPGQTTNETSAPPPPFPTFMPYPFLPTTNTPSSTFQPPNFNLDSQGKPIIPQLVPLLVSTTQPKDTVVNDPHSKEKLQILKDRLRAIEGAGGRAKGERGHGGSAAALAACRGDSAATGATVTAAAALPLQGVTSATAAARKGGDRGVERTMVLAQRRKGAACDDRENGGVLGRVSRRDGGGRRPREVAARFLRKNRREERGVAAIDGGTVKEARSSGATAARGARPRRPWDGGATASGRGTALDSGAAGGGGSRDNHTTALRMETRLPAEKGKRPGKSSGQIDKSPGKPSGGKGKDLENHQVKLINSWKTIRRKGKRPGKLSGQIDKNSWKTIRRKRKRPGKPSGGKGKDLENHQLKLIRLLANYQEEREKTWKTIRLNSWKTIRRKGKRPGKPSGQTDKTPGKSSGGKGKDLENHQVKLIRLLENHQEERKIPGKSQVV